MAQSPDPRRNRLLAALPPSDYERLLPRLELVQMKLAHALYESGGAQKHVYFPLEGIVSMLYVTKSGASAELAVVGNEGMIGVSLFMGGDTTPNRAVVQSTCAALRLSASRLKDEFHRGGPTQVVLLKYTQALITQISQTAVCNLHHSVDQQLCRWLLLSLDRLPANELQMTQELIASMLGVRRQGVTEAAGALETSGLIRYKRGLITVLDRPKLEARACECYGVVKREYDRLLSSPGLA
jgi:CRP-like cAMP-binding protein